MWASENETLILYTPMPTTDPQGNHRIGTQSTGFTTFNLDEPPPFTQIRTVDLTSPVEVEELLQEQIPTLHQLDFRLDRYTETVDWGNIAPIDILSNTNILDFLLANHSGFSEDDPIREGYDFMGWYLNPAFVTPLTEFTRMPARDTTLYAAWLPIEAPTHTITFHPGLQGTFTGNTTITQQIQPGGSIMDVPQIQPNNGWQFAGWLKSSTNGAGGTNDNTTPLSPEQVMALEITADTTFTAQYTTIAPPPSHHTVIFDAEAFIVGDDPFGDDIYWGSISITVPHGDNIPWMQIPEPHPNTAPSGHTFTGWLSGTTGAFYTPEQLGEIIVISDMAFWPHFEPSGGWWRSEPAHQTE